jgi:hypothetical protein
VLAFVLVGSSLGGALIPEQARAAAVSAGRLSLLDRYDGGQTRALQYAPFARLDQPAVARRATVVESLSGSPWTQSVPDHLGPYALAPGRYQFRIWFRHREAGGVFDLVSHPGPGIIGRIRVEDANTIAVEIDLPVPVPPLYLHTADVALQKAVRQVDIVPLAVVPPGDRLPETDVREVEWIAPRPAGLLVYLDRHAFPERGQFWTEGAAATRVLVAPAGAQRLALSVHCGPAGGALTLTVAGHRMDWTLAANETRTFDTPIDGQTSLVPVEIATPVRFRPADVDPSSQDRRWLGCHVSVALP